MMVGDDQLEPQFACEQGLGDARDSAIDAHHEPLRILLMQLPQRLAIDAVTFFEAGGDVIVGPPTGERDAVPQQGRGGDAVDVVVAVNRDPPLGANRGNNAIGGIRQAGKLLRLVEGREPRVQKRRRVMPQSTGDEHLGHQGRDA